jgi:hypothetical protein
MAAAHRAGIDSAAPCRRTQPIQENRGESSVRATIKDGCVLISDIYEPAPAPRSPSVLQYCLAAVLLAALAGASLGFIW